MKNVVGIKSRQAVTYESMCQERFVASLLAIKQSCKDWPSINNIVASIVDGLLDPDTFNIAQIVTPLTVNLIVDLMATVPTCWLNIQSEIDGDVCILQEIKFSYTCISYGDGNLFNGAIDEMMAGLAIPHSAMVVNSGHGAALAPLLHGYYYLSGFIAGVLNGLHYELKELITVVDNGTIDTVLIIVDISGDRTIRITDHSCSYVAFLLKHVIGGGNTWTI